MYVTEEACMWRSNHLVWTGCIVAAVTLAACGVGTSGGSPGAGVTPLGASEALAAWSKFPVAAKPRPVVLLGSEVIGPASGFRNGEDKMAFVSGTFKVPTSLPGTTTSPDGQQVVSAASAFTLLGGARHNTTQAAPVLTVTGARLTRTMFATDRGLQSLPAWAFTFRGVTDPVFVLALPDSAWWPHVGTPVNQVVAVPDGSQTDRRVTVWFTGGAAGTGPCTVQYSASVAVSLTAVVVTPNPVPNNAADGVACADVGYRRSVTVTLATPLGNRVLLTPDPAPAPSR